MSELLERAVATMRALPEERQDEIARLVLSFADGNEAPIELTAEEDEALARSEAAASRGEYATDEHLAAIWAKHGL